MSERATPPPATAATTPDMAAFWMPFTANRQFKSAPRLLSSAKGMYYTSHDGRRILDGTAGLWCVNAGHCRDEIVAAVQAQAAEMDFAPTFQKGVLTRYTGDILAFSPPLIIEDDQIDQIFGTVRKVLESVK